MEGYCVKCKKKQEMKSAKCITIKKNGRSAMKGVCPKCGCKMMRFVSSKDCKNKSKRNTQKEINLFIIIIMNKSITNKVI